METLGLRRPRFSEDLAWLPGWVQHQVEQFDDCENEYLGSSKLNSKVPTVFQGNIFSGNEVVVSLKEHGGHNSHRLFLSGEDNSASSFTSSSRNVLQFHLHLSSNGVSQCTPSSVRASSASQMFSEPNRVLPMHKFETSVTAKENSLGLNVIPKKSSPEQRQHHPANCENSARHSKEKSRRGRLKHAEIKDAVELSISASEALAIHEVVTSGLDSKELVAADALEVSLQMKQARLQWLEDAFDFSMETDETDSLSDLDDFAMIDAFEDVGLVCSSDEHYVSDSSISLVKETPVSENHSGSVDLPVELVNCDDISTQKKSETILNSDGKPRKDFLVESLSCERQRKLFDNPKMALKQVEQTNPKMILKAFTCETSFLSESADIAPDENSFVQIREINSHAESQSSIAVEVLLDKASNEISFSQDVVQSSSQSFLDPLCSVVPCSLSIEDINTAEAQKHDNVGTDFGSDMRPKSESEMENLCKISSLDFEIECVEEQVAHIVNKCLEGSIRKHMTSLKTYSTFFPSSVATSDKGVLHCNQSFQSQYGCGQSVFNQSMDCVGASDELISKHLPLFTSTLKCIPGSKNEDLHRNEELNKKNASNGVSARNGSNVAGYSPKEGKKPYLNLIVQASKPSIVNSSGGGHPEQALGTDDVIRLQSSEKPQSLRPIYKNPNHRSFQAKKRVRFSEPEDQIKQNKSVLELNSSGRMRSTKTTSKKIKYIDKSSDCRTCEESFLNHHSNVDKGNMLQGMQFLLTGLSRQKEKDIKGKIQKHGGIILPDIPSPLYSTGSKFLRSNWYQRPIILSTRKQRTAKFLYGCAINTFVLHVNWLADSIGMGSILPPEQYLILPWQAEESSNIMNQVHENNTNAIFEELGVMLYGKHSFCTKLENIIKHGGGQVFKTVQRLVQRLNKEKISVGAIVTEDDNLASRHLRQCATEWKIPMLSSSWIIKSLYSGKLLPFTE